MSSKEIEIKFRVGDEGDILRRLGSLGAKKSESGLEHNIVFDSADGNLREDGFLLRLRKFAGRNVLTFKKAITQGEFKEADEIQTDVKDFDLMKEILTNLGYEIFWIYEKETDHYAIGGTYVCIDRLPFGTFMEIEGEPEKIREVASGLGLDMKNGITKTYLELYEDFCREQGKEMENLVFFKKSR